MKVTDKSSSETVASTIQYGECCRWAGEIFMRTHQLGHAFVSLSTGKGKGFDPSTVVSKVEAEVIVK